MYKKAIIKNPEVQFTILDMKPVKLHSNLYVSRGDLEFVANTQPVVGGYVVIDPLQPAPYYMSKEEFVATYREV